MGEPTSGRWAVRARWVFDGTALLPSDRPLVVIEDGSIVAVDASRADVPAALPVVDLGEATLLPGLIDTHTHLAFDATDDPASHVQAATADDLLAHMRTVARSMLACGITSARDLGDRDYLSLTIRSETTADPKAGPTIIAAGPPLTPVGGHCWFLGCQANGPDGMRAAVTEHAERGVDVIKVMATGGRMTPTTLPHESQYDVVALRAAVDAAHAHGLPAAAHCHGGQGVADALAAGFDTLEHVSFMTADGIAPDQMVIDAIGRRGTIVSITVGNVPGRPLPPAMQRLLPRLAAHVRNLADSGVRLTLGPDGGIAPSKPHTVLCDALVDVVELAGLPTAAALTAATATAAEACGIAGRTGRIAAGYDADLLAVDGNLLDDITRVHGVAAVWRRGDRVR